MAKQELRFRAKIEGKEAGVVAAIAPPVDVPWVFRHAGPRADTRDDQRISVSFVADAVWRAPDDARE